MFKKIIFGILLTLASASVANATPAATPEVHQLEQCGIYGRTAPWCHEALEGDTRELQSVQAFVITLQNPEEWRRLHRDRRGIAIRRTNAEGQTELSGRPVIMAVVRLFLYPPPGSPEEPMLFQGVMREDGTALVGFLPADGNFTGWSVYVPSSEGRHVLTSTGQIVRVSGGRHHERGNLVLQLNRLPASPVPAIFLISRGDGSNVIESLENTFADHALVSDGRVYSGLPGTFQPLSPDGSSVAAMHTSCRNAGQRLEARGNLRIDTATIPTAIATSGLSLIPQIIQNGRALLARGCR